MEKAICTNRPGTIERNFLTIFIIAGVAEGAEGGREVRDPQAELVDALPVLEGDCLELRPESPHARVPHAVVALMLQPDRLPRRLGVSLPDQHRVHLRRGGPKQRGERLLILAPGDSVVLDRVPQGCGLHVRLHHHRLVGVLPPLQHREDEARAASAAGLAHHLPLHHDFSAPSPNSATPAAWRAPSLRGSWGHGSVRWGWRRCAVRSTSLNPRSDTN